MNIISKLLGEQDGDAEKTPESSRYRCVLIRVDCDSACRAALSVAGKKFLVNEIPQLPLPDCDRQNCTCSYELQEDRRSARRRAADAGMKGAVPQES
ncbi:MAG: hypothetical protein R3315_10265 [Woeseiaceae bacterium]|nr:hypothetical protein [Woeseiaceae bacterium]